MEKATVDSKVVDSKVFEAFVQKIMECNTLDELIEVGREMMLYEMSGYKRALITMYKTRRGELVRELLNKNGVFSNLYFLLKTAKGNAFKQVGKLIYNLKDKDILTKGEINYLFELYERRKETVQDQDNEEVE